MTLKGSSPTVAALFEPSIPLDVDYKGVRIHLEARPSGFTGKLIAQINEAQTIEDDALFSKALDNIASIVDGLVVRWDLKQNGSDNFPLVFVPGTKQRAQIVGLYPEFVKAQQAEKAAYDAAVAAFPDLMKTYRKLSDEEKAQTEEPTPPEAPAAAFMPDNADLVELDDVTSEEWASFERTGPGMLYVMDAPDDHLSVRGVRKDTYLPVSDVTTLKAVPLAKNYETVRSLPLPFMQFLMGEVMAAGTPKA